MDVRHLRAWEPAPERLTPAYGGNATSPEPFVILHRPLIREYQLRWLDLQADLAERTPGKDTPPGDVAAGVRAAIKMGDAYRSDFLRAHVTGSEGLTDGGEPMALDGLLALLDEVPDLGRDVLSGIVTGGTMTEADAGN